jgi:hypothetical protein
MWTFRSWSRALLLGLRGVDQLGNAERLASDQDIADGDEAGVIGRAGLIGSIA